ncbi:MAG: hypothetical protein LBQ02_02930 [Candidatus Nomurabacteria bacterium]|jgi:hypothetical protein|nr:hypothetical protein [Candidatus Nomurabacteria bacterium]
MDKKLTFRIAWGVFFLLGAILILLAALDVIPITLNPFALMAVVLLAAFAAYSAYKLFWFGVFFPIAISLSIIDAGTELSMNTTAHVAVYITALLLAIAFTVIFHKKGTWEVWHKPTPKK